MNIKKLRLYFINYNIVNIVKFCKTKRQLWKFKMSRSNKK